MRPGISLPCIVGAWIVACAPMPRTAPRGPAPVPAPPTTMEMETATLRLTAVCAGADAPTSLAIALTFESAGAPVFGLADRVQGAAGMTALVDRIEATDERGPLGLVRQQAGGDLRLVASRAVQGSVTLRWRARSVAASERGALFGLRHDATGVGGHGAHFLILPEDPRSRRIRVVWGPTDCAGEVRGMSSYGEEAAEFTGTLAQLGLASFFAGRPTRVGIDRGDLHVRSAWFGAPAFDPVDAAAWASRAYAAERAFFADEDPGPYAIFVRVVDEMGARGKGTGHPRSFLASIGPATAWDLDFRTRVAHEMLHRWIGLGVRFAGPDGTHFWFTEGFTVHYARALMLRAGLMTPDEFAADLERTTAMYHANEHITAANDEIRAHFWDDESFATLPYVRGSLYAAELDADIRRASHGARSLDDVMRALHRRSLTAPINEFGLRELSVLVFRELVAQELGEAGVQRFTAVILDGELAAPAADAFGPCFRRVARATAPFQLGFDEPRSLAERRVHGVVAGSAAARAGLQDGDELVAFESPRLRSDRPAVITVTRAGGPKEIRWLPARTGPKVAGYAWVRAPGVPDDRCASPWSLPG